MAEIFFYHLESHDLKSVLPSLLEKCLSKGWRACVEVGEAEDIDALDTHLWSFSDASFLPHAKIGDPHEQDQPILLVNDDVNPNKAEVRFSVGRAAPSSFDGYERLIYIFDGTDPAALTDARGLWKSLKSDHELTYWQQNEAGGWAKKA